MSKVADSIRRGLEQAVAYAEGWLKLTGTTFNIFR